MIRYELAIGLAVASFLFAWLITQLVRRNAAQLRLIQIPNARSSHSVPTPSGGGISIALAGTVAGVTLVLSFNQQYLFVAVGLSFASAFIGILDDRYELSSRLRLTLQCAMVIALMAMVGSLPTVTTPLGLMPQPILYILIAFCSVWWINLFNFMDGIDGLAAAESIYVLGGAITLCLLIPGGSGSVPMLWWALSVAAATAGFLLLNWPPAKIFMGDAGSNYLAVVIFSILLLLIAMGAISYPVAIILCALFVTDASVTLISRMLHRERWSAAHRLHAYQKLSRRWKSHRRVTVLYTAINLLWIYPMAYFAQTYPSLAWSLVFVAHLPLALAFLTLGAGRPESTAPAQKDTFGYEE